MNLTWLNWGLAIVLGMVSLSIIALPTDLSRPNWEFFPEMKRSPAWSSYLVQPVYADLVLEHPGRNELLYPADPRFLGAGCGRGHRVELGGSIFCSIAQVVQAQRNRDGASRRHCSHR